MATVLNPLKAELNPICHLLALLGGATIVVVSRLRVNGGSVEALCVKIIAGIENCRICGGIFQLVFH